jgi:hypothetical protein
MDKAKNYNILNFRNDLAIEVMSMLRDDNEEVQPINCNFYSTKHLFY